jgi:hypothetical protein
MAQACKEMSRREAEADELTREVLTALRRTFITPLDRGGIKDLITSMDDANEPDEPDRQRGGKPIKTRGVPLWN